MFYLLASLWWKVAGTSVLESGKIVALINSADTYLFNTFSVDMNKELAHL